MCAQPAQLTRILNQVVHVVVGIVALSVVTEHLQRVVQHMHGDVRTLKRF
jgi:hypothetical protein